MFKIMLDLVSTITLYVNNSLHKIIHLTNVQLSLEHIEGIVRVGVPDMLLYLIGCLQFEKGGRRSIFSFLLVIAL